MVHASSAHTTLDVYRQRKPQDSAYYRCVEDYFETLEQVYQERFEQKYGFFRPYAELIVMQIRESWMFTIMLLFQWNRIIL